MRVQIVAVMRKEVRQAFRDRRMAVILIMAPLVQVILLGYAVDLDVRDIRTAVSDQDHTAESRRLVDGLLADRTLQRASETDDPSGVMERGEASVVVVVPRGYARRVTEGSPTQVQVLVDGTDSVRAQVTLNTAMRYLQLEALRLAQARLAQAAALQGLQPGWPTIRLEPRIYYNPRLRSPIYMVPAVAAVTLLVVTTIVTAMGLAREKEMGTVEQLMITPMRPLVLLLGKTLPFALIGLVVSGVVLAVGTNLFDVPVRGSLAVIFLGVVLYLMSTLGVGVFVSTIARTQMQAILGGFFFLLPAILLSGFMSPIEYMPRWIQPLTYLNPVRYIVEILRAGLLKGAALSDLWPQLAALALFGAAIFGLAALRFRKQMA